MTADAPRLAIFARAPVLGRVKTRLARSVGEEAALAAYRELLALTLHRLAPGTGRFAVGDLDRRRAPKPWRRGGVSASSSSRTGTWGNEWPPRSRTA